MNPHATMTNPKAEAYNPTKVEGLVLWANPP